MGLDLEEEGKSRARTLSKKNRDRNCGGYKKPYKINDKESCRGLEKVLQSSKVFCWPPVERVFGVSFWRERWKCMLNALIFYTCFDWFM